ncbi:hypothetical protein EYM_06785 [Ignicoccus islandicus DSM 13165]|uniref:Uncharacterized protein n=1 Tax=Ignicoccus islandicus DSM 13165 TaxID=940295 RepID=A0A0U2WP44_9CREN|nr:hypothetical protein [Ignicoccus islandicus]ALU12721.1 hypothetical protein EYM_06785 [Ignicoccus islandicus DSM 13165]
MFGLMGIAVEYALAVFLPIAALLAYFYLASLRALLLGSPRAKNSVILLGMTLLWLSAIPGPIVFIGAFLVSIVLFALIWWPRIGNKRPSIRELLRSIKLSNLKSKFREGCKSFAGCLVRYVLSWPAGAVFAVTLQGILSPLVMFILGYEANSNVNLPKFVQENKLAETAKKILRYLMALIAWAFAILNIITNVLMPRWIIVQEKIVSGEVKGLPLAARLLSQVIGKEASYVYGVLVVILALYTAYRAYQYVSKRLNDAYLITILSPFVAFAISANKLGEPLTSIGYAIGMSVALRPISLPNANVMKGPARIKEITVKVTERLGRAILEYEVPLGPLAWLLGVAENGGKRNK